MKHARNDCHMLSINLMQHTTLGVLAACHQVNLEVDLVAPYVEKMWGAA